MKAPKRTEEWDPPSCLTDGSNEQIPRDYIHQWRVTEANKEQRITEILYTLNLLKNKGMAELISNPQKYERDFYLLCKGTFKVHNNKYVNRQLILQALIDGGVIELAKDYWNAIVQEFELKKQDCDEKLVTAGQLWKSFTETQKHLVHSLMNWYNLLIIFWNGSDMKIDEILKVLYEGVIEFILQSLDKYLSPLEVDSNHPQHKLVTAALGIIHNFCNKYDTCLADLRQREALRIAAQYRRCGTSTLKTKSILSCSYLLTEQDGSSTTAIIELDETDIEFVIKVLRDALNNTNEHSRKYGYHADELIAGLNNIAVVDANKSKLVKAGVLPLYVEALGRNKPGLQEAAAKGIWALAFDEESKNMIKQEPGCMGELHKLADSQIPALKSAAGGAIWKVEGETQRLQKVSSKTDTSDETGEKKIQHIMISYQWDVQIEVLKIRKRLKEAGYRVWIDVEHMSGSTLQSMAKAVESSALFVPILTEKYKASSAGRQEIEYAHHLQKKIIPIRLQPKYRPDGWLGFLLGSTYFYDLSKKADYENKFQSFLQAAGEDGKIRPGEDENPVIEIEEEEVVESAANTAALPTAPAQLQPYSALLQRSDSLITGSKAEFNIASLNCQGWTSERVGQWLTEYQLSEYIDKFSGIDGALLAELAAMRVMSPDVYYDLMKSEYHMPLLHLLRLNLAIRKLICM